MTHDELDLVVMAQVMAGCFAGETSSHRRQERGKLYTIFHHNDVRVCQKTFLFLHTYHGILALQSHQGQLHGKWTGGQGPWQHAGKRKQLGLSLKQIQDVVQFILNYAGVWRERISSGFKCMTLYVCYIHIDYVA